MRTFRFGVLPVLLFAMHVMMAPSVSAQSKDDAEALNKEALQLLNAGKYQEALPSALNALARAERLNGPDHLVVARCLGTLGFVYVRLGRYAEAEPVYKRALAIREKRLGMDHPEVGISLNNLAVLYRRLDREAETEPLYRRDLAILEKTLGPEHEEVGTSLGNLGTLLQNQGRYAEAEQYFKRSLNIREKVLGPNHADVGYSLGNLAFLYVVQERFELAEPVFKRSIAILERTLGGDHPELAAWLNRFAALYDRQGRDIDAALLFERALRIREKALGPDHPAVAESANSLATVYDALGRTDEAEQLYKRGLSIREKTLGSQSSELATSVHDLGAFYRRHARYADAEPLYKRALAIREKLEGSDHPSVGNTLGGLALIHYRLGHWNEAADFLRRETQVIIRRLRRGTQDMTAALKFEAADARNSFKSLVKVLNEISKAQTASDRDLREDAFVAAQWAQSSEAATSLAQMSARQAKGDDVLARLVRERQDLAGEWQKRDEALIAARSQAPEKRNAATENGISTRLSVIDARISQIDATLRDKFAEYVSLASPDPMTIAGVQSILSADEVLLLFLDTPKWPPTPEQSFVWIISKSDARWLSINLGTDGLTNHAEVLRCGLDAELWEDVESADKCRQALNAAPSTELIRFGDKDTKVRVLPFDTARAHDLYKALLGPAEDSIKGKQLPIVPSGPLTGLPFNVLVAEPPKTAIPATLADYRDVTWLGARQSITVLPSVASLKALRQFAKTSRASRPYLGVGNPLLDGDKDNPHDRRRAELAREKQHCPKTLGQQIALAAAKPLVAFGRFFHRGAAAGIEAIREIPSLPETADELCEVARRLSVPDSDVLLGASASETKLKDLSDQGRLAEYAILHFATHGALSGQITGSAEPGLILTPPPKGSTNPKILERDDGYLTSSEIATLKMDADWVILSACNTAGAQSENAEALSGMARAFFYAGARALLVSHWAVGSDAAVKLTTRAFAELKAHPKVGRAEAFRISMKELIEKGSLLEAHPKQWAPFVVVGEGTR